MSNERYCISQELSKFLMEELSFNEHYHLIAKFNFWQSKKWLGEIQDVENDIRTIDLSAKQSLFRLTRFALLDDYDNFFSLLPSVVDSGELQIEQLKIWPIFKDCRMQEQYSLYIDGVEGCSEELKLLTSEI